MQWLSADGRNVMLTILSSMLKWPKFRGQNTLYFATNNNKIVGYNLKIREFGSLLTSGILWGFSWDVSKITGQIYFRFNF